MSGPELLRPFLVSLVLVAALTPPLIRWLLQRGKLASAILLEFHCSRPLPISEVP